MDQAPTIDARRPADSNGDPGHAKTPTAVGVKRPTEVKVLGQPFSIEYLSVPTKTESLIDRTAYGRTVLAQLTPILLDALRSNPHVVEWLLDEVNS